MRNQRKQKPQSISLPPEPDVTTHLKILRRGCRSKKGAWRAAKQYGYDQRRKRSLQTSLPCVIAGMLPARLIGLQLIWPMFRFSCESHSLLGWVVRPGQAHAHELQHSLRFARSCCLQMLLPPSSFCQTEASHGLHQHSA